MGSNPEIIVKQEKVEDGWREEKNCDTHGTTVNDESGAKQNQNHVIISGLK